jgi:hypothetical protein
MIQIFAENSANIILQKLRIGRTFRKNPKGSHNLSDFAIRR